ncbi:MAG TPA: hypothetical protein H9742_14100 [Candidatus Acetatifactor stercoripullorum]|uniref:Uncharacterized protein n=1 Tax=Candidatus Acetatifactor stercoripullorum TaxID=2838414 RepID=A0A9D1R8V3_9FIRM|nr:hypothetical protein [Candidatus Acetatifactor stercoripullorum]
MGSTFLDVLLSIISGIISGIIASILLNYYYWNKKPKLLISNQIAKNLKNEYRIKIVNLSNFYVTNVFIQVHLVTVSNGDGGNILNVINLDIPYKTIQIIAPYDDKDVNASYAIRFVLPKNLETLWENDDHTYLKLVTYCSNEHNNSSKLYEKIYYKKSNSIKNGEFEFGKSINIR